MSATPPCPNCQTPLEIEREGFDGPPKQIRCPKCETVFATLVTTEDDGGDGGLPPDAHCGCQDESCICGVPLTADNVMAVPIGDKDSPDEIELLLCFDCCVGNHKRAAMNAPRFAGEYAANRKEIHNAVRASVGNRCIRCFHPEGDRPDAFMPCDEKCTHPRDDGKMRILTVHHLNGKKDDNRWWNLLALCQSCHLSIQSRVIPERPWLFSHSEWFRPYVCGFYAAYYLRLDITREEALANPDRYLRAGQPWLYEEAS